MTLPKRLDDLPVGAACTLRIGEDVTYALLLNRQGEGDQRTLTFSQVARGGGRILTWNAYRFRGRWCYGSGADRLVLLAGAA
jgi:hypothetical protein